MRGGPGLKEKWKGSKTREKKEEAEEGGHCLEKG